MGARSCGILQAITKTFNFTFERNGEFPEGFKQRSNIIELQFLQVDSGCCVESGQQELKQKQADHLEGLTVFGVGSKNIFL